MADLESVDVAVIGAGVSGLAAAYELRKRNRSVAVLERGTRAGGIVWTERIGDFTIDAGPDALLIQKPAAVALCNELGIADRLFPTKVPRTAFILRNGRLHPLPGASMLGFPTRLGPLFKSTLFSTTAKLRMAAELLVPRGRTVAEDESIGGFVRRRFGQEAVTYVAEPLLAGIHAGDVERLSMHALFPRLIEAEAQTGSVIRSFMRQSRQPLSGGVFRSFPNGLGELIDGLLRALPRDVVRFDCDVTRIERNDRFTIHVKGAPAFRTRAVIASVPAFAAAELFRPLDSDLADACGSVRYLSTATAVFAFPREAIHHPLQGTGFVVPRTEGLSITAGAWITSKWPLRAPEGHALIRGFLGGARDPDLLSRSDQDIAGAALDDLSKILGIRTAPELTRVYRWNRSSPQLEVGHGRLMAQIDQSLARHAGLFVSAAGFRGVGIPDCIADARATAAAAAEFAR